MPKKGYKSVPWLFQKEIEIPEEWEIRKAKDISKKISVGIATSTTKYIVDEKGIPLLRNQNIHENRIDIEDLQYISKEFAQKNSSKQIHEGDIISTRTGYVGRSAVVLPEMNGWQTFTTLIITPNIKIITSSYLCIFLNSRNAKKQYTFFQAGSSQQNLNAGEISNVLVLFPPLPEQQQIASILSNVDHLIQNTEKLIEKTTRLKKGLMQKLLTRGIGHTKFKKVPWWFGKTIEIPEEWEDYRIGEIVKFEGGSQPERINFRFQPTKDYIRLIQIRDFKTDQYQTYIPINSTKKFFTKEDIMIGRYGPPNFQILRGLDGAYNVALIKAIPTKTTKNYLYYFLKQKTLFKIIDSLATRTAGQNGIELDILRRLPFPLPPKEEEQQIASILSNTDKKIQSYERYKEKLQRLKKSLMQKLLTGEVRVAV